MTRVRMLSETLIFASVFFMLVFSGSAQSAELKEAVEQLADQLAKSVPEGRTLRVVVADFPDLERVTSNLGRYIAERLTTRLSAHTQKFRVIERRRLAQVLGELRFSMSDLVDPDKAKQLGRMLGAEAIVVGTVSDLGNVVDVDARIIEIETNNSLPGVTAAISQDDTVRRMKQEGRVAEAVSPQPPVVSIPQQQRQTVTAENFTLELTSTEIVGNTIRFTFMYTSLRERPDSDYIQAADNINSNYMIDNLGDRYKLVAGSDIRGGLTVPPKIPLRQWVSFEAPQASASLVHVFLSFARGQVAFRNIPLPR